MRKVEHDDRFYVDDNGFDKLWKAMMHAALLQFNGERRSIPIYQHGEIVEVKRF